MVHDKHGGSVAKSVSAVVGALILCVAACDQFSPGENSERDLAASGKFDDGALPDEDGEPCYQDAMCESGICACEDGFCDEGICVPSACVLSGGACGYSAADPSSDCCEDSERCIEYTVYDFPRCIVPRPTGEFCYADDQCTSYHCGPNGTCADA